MKKTPKIQTIAFVVIILTAGSIIHRYTILLEQLSQFTSSLQDYYRKYYIIMRKDLAINPPYKVLIPAVSWKEENAYMFKENVKWFINNHETHPYSFSMDKISSKLTYAERAIKVNRGDTVTIEIEIECIVIYPINYSPYVYIDVRADESFIDYYIKNHRYIYSTIRDCWTVYLPIFIGDIEMPGYQKLEPNTSRIFNITFTIPPYTKPGYYPIVIYINQYILINNTLIGTAGHELPYILEIE